MKRNKLVKYDGQTYLVNDIEIHKVSFEFREVNTKVSVIYCGSIYEETAFYITHKEGKPDLSTLSSLYAAIIEVNRAILSEAA